MSKTNAYLLAPSLILFGLFALPSCLPAPNEARQEANRLLETPDGALFGVVTEFVVHQAAFTHAENVQVTLKMTNVTDRSVRFRYSSCFEVHIHFYDAQGKRVSWKQGAPIPECPFQEIEIKPGTTVEQKESFHFGGYYSVLPGIYTMALSYDRRLMKGAEGEKEPWVPWGMSRFKVTVKE